MNAETETLFYPLPKKINFKFRKEKKIMKKVNLTKMVALLACLCLMTSAFAGSTLAKYVTKTEATDSARVAYWGFNEDTANQDTTFTLFESNDAGVLNNGSGLLAPGSKASASINFSYKDATTPSVTAPEVDYEFKVIPTITSANADATNSLDKNTNFTWSVDAPGSDNDKTGIQTIEDLKAAIMAIAGDNTTGVKQYEAGTLPTGFDAGENTITIGWEWVFEDTTDVMDTAMGNADALETVEVKIDIVATQLDAIVAP